MTASEEPFNKVLVVIANYDFSGNADLLKRNFCQRFRTLLIDASSPERPKCADITIPNSYYPGLWNAAVSEAIQSGAEWLFFIASDIQFSDYETLFENLKGVLVRADIGIYTPSLKQGSRLSYPACFNYATAGLRECTIVEGFCFLARTKILKRLYPVPPENTYGWQVDSLASRIARGMNKRVVVDDRIKIFHPEALQKHAVPADSAQRQGMAYYEEMADAIDPDGANFQEWADVAKKDIEARGWMLGGQVFRSLDIGCGHNPRNVFAAQEVYGIDIDPALNLKNKRIMIADLVIEAIPASDSSFDYITAFDFIEHVPRIVYAPARRNSFVELMNEIWRVLKPGGIFLSLTPAFPNPQAFQDPTHVNFITEETFLKYFDNHYRWASMYGFKGYFEIEKQKWETDGKLATWMRAVRKL